MLTWVVYDITEDKIRNSISEKCLNMGLRRVQYSVFLGDLNNNERDEIAVYAEDIIEEEENDRVYIFPMCREDFERVQLIGQEFDKELVADELTTHMF